MSSSWKVTILVCFFIGYICIVLATRKPAVAHHPALAKTLVVEFEASQNIKKGMKVVASETKCLPATRENATAPACSSQVVGEGEIVSLISPKRAYVDFNSDSNITEHSHFEIAPE